MKNSQFRKCKPLVAVVVVVVGGCVGVGVRVGGSLRLTGAHFTGIDGLRSTKGWIGTSNGGGIWKPDMGVQRISEISYEIYK